MYFTTLISTCMRVGSYDYLLLNFYSYSVVSNIVQLSVLWMLYIGS